MRNAEYKGEKNVYEMAVPQSTFHNPHSKGFTLLEVLLALAILTVVVAVIYTSFSTASRSVESAEAIRDDTDLARTLIARVSDDIVNAYCSQNMKTTTFFYGKKEEKDVNGNKVRLDSLFLTTLTNWRRPDSKETDLWEVGYFFNEKPDGKGYVLMRREKRELSKDFPPLEGGVEYEITDRIDELQIRYYDGSKWLDETGGKNLCIPQAVSSVEIALTLAGGKTYTTQVKREKLALN